MLNIYADSLFGKFLQAAESKLSKFVEDIIVPPRMIDIIVDGEVITCILSPYQLSLPYYCVYTMSIYFNISYS